MRAALLALLLVGCDNSWGHGAIIKPVPDEPRWRAQVTAAADAWNVALAECDGPAFIVWTEGHPVKLVPRTELAPDVAGRFSGDSIEVKEGLEAWELPVLMHELGHSLGLDHVSEEEDPDSIMNPTIGPSDVITDGDVVRAGCM